MASLQMQMHHPPVRSTCPDAPGQLGKTQGKGCLLQEGLPDGPNRKGPPPPAALSCTWPTNTLAVSPLYSGYLRPHLDTHHTAGGSH